MFCNFEFKWTVYITFFIIFVNYNKKRYAQKFFELEINT